MAARTGASIGVAVAITILAVFAFAFFVMTMVFFGQAQDRKRQANEANEAMQIYVLASEREQQTVRAALQRAQAKDQSLVRYLLETEREIMEATTGDRDMTPDQFAAAVERIEGAETAPLFGLIDARDERISTLEGDRDAAIAGRDAERLRAEREADRVNQLATEFNETGQVLQAAVTDYTSQITDTRERYNLVETRLQTDHDRAAAQWNDERRSIQAEIAELTNQNLILQDQVRRLRQEGATDVVRPISEDALVDGSIQGVNGADREVVLSIGRAQKVILGMSFAVYGDATLIRADNLTGEYAPGKAIVEVVQVEDFFSRARIISEGRGNPIVRGDVVANAVYDPGKTYKLVVFGNFDINRDGIKSRFERDDVAAMISRWGGQVVDELEGDVDFLVLGERPTLPPRPTNADSIEIINEYLRLESMVRRYDELRDQATSTSVPVLNENRLRTLIGDYPQ